MMQLVSLVADGSSITDADEEVHNNLALLPFRPTSDADMTQDLLALLGAQPDEHKSHRPRWLPWARSH